MLRVIFSQYKILCDRPFLPFQKREIVKKKFLRQHAFECGDLCLKGGSPDRESTDNEDALMATIDSMNKDSTRLSDGPDWTFELLDVYLAEIDRVASSTALIPILTRLKSSLPSR